MDIPSFLDLSDRHAAADSLTKDSVRRTNKIADQLRSLILQALKDPCETNQLLSLCDHPTAGGWVAYTVLKEGQLSDAQRTRCLETIRGFSKRDDVSGLAARMWLKKEGYEA
jgi:hypothetical protein